MPHPLRSCDILSDTLEIFIDALMDYIEQKGDLIDHFVPVLVHLAVTYKALFDFDRRALYIFIPCKGSSCNKKSQAILLETHSTIVEHIKDIIAVENLKVCLYSIVAMDFVGDDFFAQIDPLVKEQLATRTYKLNTLKGQKLPKAKHK